MPAVGLGTMTRIAGYVAIALAIVTTAIHLRHSDTNPGVRAGVAAAPSTDPLAQELTRCRTLGTAAADDAACASAWAENRRRFFTYAPLSTPSPRAPAGNPNCAKSNPEAKQAQ